MGNHFNGYHRQRVLLILPMMQECFNPPLPVRQGGFVNIAADFKLARNRKSLSGEVGFHYKIKLHVILSVSLIKGHNAQVLR